MNQASSGEAACVDLRQGKASHLTTPHSAIPDEAAGTLKPHADARTLFAPQMYGRLVDPYDWSQGAAGDGLPAQ